MKGKKSMMEKTLSELAFKNADPEEAKMNDDSKENETGDLTEEKSTGGEAKSDPAEERDSAAEGKGPVAKERGLTAEEKSLATDDGLSNTPYDDVFRTIINDARELVLPLLNEIFGDHYTGEEKIEFAQDTHTYARSLLVSMSRVVLRHIAAKYEKVREEMEEIMGGRILDYEAKRIRMEVEEKYETQIVQLDEEKKKSQAKWMEDMVRAVRNLMETIGLTKEEAMSAMKMSESDRKVIAPLV